MRGNFFTINSIKLEMNSLRVLMLFSATFFLASEGVYGGEGRAVSATDITDAILGRTAVTPEMDINQDSKVDVADVIALSNVGPIGAKRFLGVMTFDSEFVLSSQFLEFTFLPNEAGTTFDALFDVSNSPFFSDAFSIEGIMTNDGMTLSFTSAGTGSFDFGTLENPLSKIIEWTLNIDEATVVDGELNATFTIAYTGFRVGSELLEATGTITLFEQEFDESQLFKPETGG